MLCFDISISEKEETLHWNVNAFENMKNLKILIIRNGKVSRGPNCFPESLRVLEWHEYPSNCLPSNFDPRKLVTCKLPNSRLTSFGFGSSKVGLKNIFLILKICKYTFNLFILFLFLSHYFLCRS